MPTMSWYILQGRACRLRPTDIHTWMTFQGLAEWACRLEHSSISEFFVERMHEKAGEEVGPSTVGRRRCDGHASAQPADEPCQARLKRSSAALRGASETADSRHTGC